MMISKNGYDFNMKPDMMKKTILFTLIAVIMGCGQGSAQAEAQKKNIPKKTVKAARPKGAVKAPDFILADLEGNRVQLADYRGKVVLLNFWGTWCGPCRKEIPDFIELVDKYQESGLEIIGVTLTSGPPENIQRFSDRMGINYTLLTDFEARETQTVTWEYGKATGRPINGIPTTFIIDREGYIVKKYIGPRPEHIFYKDLKPYL